MDCVALFGTRNDDNLNRIYRLCAWFGVGTLAVVGSRAVVKGPLFSAAGRVDVVRFANATEFLEWRDGNIVVAAMTGGAHPARLRVTGRMALCLGSEIAPVPPEVRQRANHVVTIPQFGRAPCLTADQAAAILLYEFMGRD